jgi:hypothetical protein
MKNQNQKIQRLLIFYKLKFSLFCCGFDLPMIFHFTSIRNRPIVLFKFRFFLSTNYNHFNFKTTEASMSNLISKNQFDNMFLGFDDYFLNSLGEDIMNENVRDWKLIYRNDEVIGLEANLRIFLKSRNDQAMEYVPDRLYSSLKYEISHEIRDLPVPILLSKIQVIDPETEEEILVDGSSLLLGNPEGVLTMGTSGEHHLKSKINFLDFPHQKKSYSMRICYYLPSDLMSPVLVIQSPEFKIYTRRTTTIAMQTKKRTRDESDFKITLDSTIKKKKVELSEYLKQLEELLQMKNKLPKDEQKEALDLAISRFLPAYQEQTQDNFEEEFESIKFEDLFTKGDCATFDSIHDKLDFDFTPDSENCTF